MVASEALAALAACPSTSLIQSLPVLYAQVQAAGLLASTADVPSGTLLSSEPARKLAALFAVALRHGLPAVIIDFLHDVCLDKGRPVSSADPVVAYLEDNFVRDWALRLASQPSACSDLAAAAAAARQGLVGVTRSTALDAALPVLSGLGSALAALAAPLAESRGRSELESAGESLRRTASLYRALAWCGAARLPAGPFAGRHRSHAAFAGAVAARRARASDLGVSLLGDVLWLAAGGRLSSYPPPSVDAALESIFAPGPAADADRLCALVYYCADVEGDAPSGGDSLAAAAGSRAGVSPLPTPAVDRVRCCAALDAGFGGDDDAVARAASRLPTVMARDGGTSAVTALRLLGRPHAALAALRTRGVPPGDASAVDAAEEVACRLDCGLLTEAFLYSRSHCDHAPGGRSRVASHMALLCRAASAAGALDSALQLPLTGEEEVGAIAWLRLQSGTPAGEMLPVYYLMRGRLPEAVAAYAVLRHKAPRPAAAPESSQLSEQLIAAAETAMAESQRRGGAPSAAAAWPVARLADETVPGAPGAPLFGPPIQDCRPRGGGVGVEGGDGPRAVARSPPPVDGLLLSREERPPAASDHVPMDSESAAWDAVRGMVTC